VVGLLAHPYRESVPAYWRLMDYLLEALKFIERARRALNAEVARTNLEMARWCLSQAIIEQSDVSKRVP